MSTRATIKIKDGSEVRWLYHHSDGYPEGVGKELEGILSDEKYWTLPSIFTRLTKDPQYEPTGGIHGDEEYGYLIDCIDRKLVGYSIYLCGYGAVASLFATAGLTKAWSEKYESSTDTQENKEENTEPEP